MTPGEPAKIIPAKPSDLDAGFTEEMLALRRRMWERFESPSYQPPMLPSVAAEIISLSTRTNVEMGDLVEVLEKDAVLAARVLKVVQSPFYAGQMAVRSLKQAVVRLGLKSLRDLVVQSALNAKLFDAGGYGREMEGLMRHSTAAAYLSRAICRVAEIDGEYAFMCGLFHDLGIAAAILVLEEMPEGKAHPMLASLWPAISHLHGDAAALVVRKWRLPATLEGVVRFHHSATSDGVTRPLTAAVRIADRLTGEIGLSLHIEGLSDPEAEGTSLEDACEILGFGESDLAAMRQEARTILAHLAQIGAA